MAERESFYKLLGLRKKASLAEIKKAYSRLARKYHPDVNIGDREFEEKYRAITLAYDVLSDPKKRKEYDKLGHHAYLSRVSVEENGVAEDLPLGAPATEAPEGEEDILERILDSEVEDKRKPVKGEDLDQPLELTFWEAIKGTAKNVKVEYEVKCLNCLKTREVNPLEEHCSQCGGRGYVKVTETVRVRVPSGAEPDKKIKVARKGLPGPQGGPRGDLFITPIIRPHKYFWREGNDLFMELPISYYEAVLGARVSVPTASGWVLLTVPPGIQNGRKLRLKGKGIKPGKGKPRGDQYVVVRIAVPEKVAPGEKALLEQLKRAHPHDPRAGLDWGVDEV